MSNVLRFNQNTTNDSFEGILKAYREKVKKIDARENIVILNLKEANIFDITLRKNIINISFDFLPETDLAYSCVLVLKQDSMGNRKVIFPENVYWSFKEVAVLATKPGFVDVITLMTIDGGETYYASHALANLGK
jgi:hypothetical protein